MMAAREGGGAPATTATPGYEEVVEALIREHLTRKQLVSTLQAFKCEQRALTAPINKRSALQALLGLSDAAAAATAGASRRSPSSSCSTLELVVQQQLRAQQSGGGGGARSQEAAAAGKLAAGGQLASRQALEQQLLAKRCLPALKKGAFAAAEPLIVGRAACAPTQQHQQQEQQQQEASAALQTGSHHLRSAVASRSRAPPAAPGMCGSAARCTTQGMHDLVLDDVEAGGSDDAEAATEPPAAALAGPAGQQQLWPHDAPAAPAAAPSRLRPGSASSRSGAAPASGGWAASGGGGGVLQAAAAFDPLPPEQQRQLSQLMWGVSAAGGAAGGGCGVQPDAAWQQGFIWSDRPGLEWGLVQTAGGPCGVLAAVQAHLIATLMDQGLWQRCVDGAEGTAGGSPAEERGSRTGQQQQQEHAVGGARPSAAELQEALAHSLALMLWQCSCTAGGGSSSSSGAAGAMQRPVQVAVLQAPPQSPGMRGLCDAVQVLRLVRVGSAHSLQEAQALVRAALPRWCLRRGWGVSLLAYSALLSRGCEGARADADAPGSPLVDALGYCSMELVNLLLTGAAASNVFDGARRFGDDAGVAAAAADGVAAAAAAPGADNPHECGGGAGDSGLIIRGIAARGRVGLLTLFEWYRYVEVGSHLKRPVHPVWVVCSESHFSVLALAAASTGQLQQALQPSARAPLALLFYDGLAAQERPVVLELRPAQPGQGWTTRLAGVAEERGTWRGEPIPPLECVLETLWPDVAVTWHGSEPIL